MREPTPSGSTQDRPVTPSQPPECQATLSADAPDSQVLHQLMADIQELRALDPAAREKLLEDLKQADPALWPLLAQQARANLAWRRQAEQRGTVGARSDGPPTPGSARFEPPADRIAARPEYAPSDQTYPPAAPFLSSEAGPTCGGPPWAANDAALPPVDDPGNPLLPADRATASASAIRTAPPDQQVPEQPATQTIPVSYESRSSDDWQGHLSKAVESLELKVADSPEADREFAQHARLRMLYLLGNRRDDALRPIPALAPAMQEFWSKQLYGLATLLDTELISQSPHRKAEAKQHLDAALSKLGESCPLVVRNLAFATDVQSYGVYKPFEKYEFVPGQQVLLYAEVENFQSNPTAKGFHTASRSSFQIFDSNARRVDQHEFSTNEEYCRNPRRDFFIVYDFRVPTRIYPGKHTLQLTIVDLNSQKIGQNVIEFAVKSTEDQQR